MAAPTLKDESEDSAEDDETTNMTEETDETEETVEGVEEELNGEDEESEPESGAEAEEEEEEVAEAQMPGDDDEVEAGEESSGGILGRINTKAIIVLSAVAIGVVLVLWFIRSAGGGTSHEPATEEDLQGDAAGEEEYDITAPNNQPLQQDQQMMGALGMGGGE